MRLRNVTSSFLIYSGQIVLSGDPHQLGPVVVSCLASRLGLSTSPMERLITSFPVYKKDENGNYNPNVITKLCNNFRLIFFTVKTTLQYKFFFGFPTSRSF